MPWDFGYATRFQFGFSTIGFAFPRFFDFRV